MTREVTGSGSCSSPGRIAETVDARPQELVDGMSLVGTETEGERRIAAFAAAGTTLMNIIPLRRDLDALLRDVSTLRELAQRVTDTVPSIEQGRS